MQQTYHKIQLHFGHDLVYAVPFLSLLANPFDPEWVETLPLHIQAVMLTDALNFSIWTGEESSEICDYARGLQLNDHVGSVVKGRFVYAVARRMLLGRDLEGARKAMGEIRSPYSARALYGWLLFLQGDPEKAASAFDAELTRLRQLCSHPRLVFADSRVESSKMALLQEVVSELRSNGHKALIFSQFVKNLHLVREVLEAMGVACRYLDGSTPARSREQEVPAFQAGQGDVFLISLKAGGTGINLTAAD